MIAANLVVENVWQQFTRGELSDLARLNPIIGRSWQRCRQLQVNPLGLDTSHVDPLQLNRCRLENKSLLDAARPVIDRLYEFVRDTGFQVVLSNEEGYLLHSVGDPEVVDRTRHLGMIPGVSWSEAAKGTNAIGTAIEENKPVQIFGAQHYCQPNQFLVCSASPIFDPDGALIGVLDLSGDFRRCTPHSLGMVVAAVGAIENHLRLMRLTGNLYAAYRYSSILLENISDAMISIDNRGTVTELNSKAARIFGIDHRTSKGKKLSELLRGETPMMLRLLEDGRPYVDREIYIARTGKTIHSSASLVRDDDNNILGAVATFHEVQRATAAGRSLRLAPSMPTLDALIGNSPAIALLKERLQQAAESSSTVLLHGESGTGKELVARILHGLGAHGNAPFVAVNCAALPESLIESELFGYEDGAFTGARRGGQAGKFELAHGGTIFLDEIGDMPPSAQLRLLRVLQERSVMRIGGTQERPVELRVIAATHHDLRRDVAQGSFREDLFYRLNVLPLRLPALRDRIADIPALAQALAERIAARMGRTARPFGKGVLDALCRYRWPGNVRQLENAIERAINWSGNAPSLELSCFDLEAESAAADARELPAAQLLVRPLNEVERENIEAALAPHHGNLQRTAQVLGISRNTLYRKLRLYGLSMQ